MYFLGILSKPVYFVKTLGIEIEPSSSNPFSRIEIIILGNAKPEPFNVKGNSVLEPFSGLYLVLFLLDWNSCYQYGFLFPNI